MATEIRHLQRTEILEVEEHFGKKQKDHQLCLIKKILFCENLTGLSRLVRSMLFLQWKTFHSGMKEIYLIQC